MQGAGTEHRPASSMPDTWDSIKDSTQHSGCQPKDIPLHFSLLWSPCQVFLGQRETGVSFATVGWGGGGKKESKTT